MRRGKMYDTMHGASIIEALFGIFIFTVGFYALYGMLNFSIQIIGQNKSRLGAMALVDEQVEYLRSLPFSSVGVLLGNPTGAIPASESISINGISYTRRNAVFWIDDPADGTAALGTDTISTDYKQVKVEVSWNFRGITRKFYAITNITPKGFETNAPGGIFKFTVFDASGVTVSGASVRIFKSGVIDVTRFTNTLGQWYEYGVPPGTDYEITVTKAGYSTSRTYSTSEVATPNPGHFTSIDDTVNPMSFSIDKISGDTIYLFSPPTQNTWTDTFADASKLQSMYSTAVSGGDLLLTQTGPDYNSPGYATSTWITPANLFQWKQLSWAYTAPGGTALQYRVYYDVGGGVPAIVPDSELPGNSAGLTVSPVDLSGLNTGSFGRTNYTGLLLALYAGTGDPAVTPSVHDVTLSYSVHAPRTNFSFNFLNTAKTIGTDASLATVYKYNLNPSTDASGVMATSTLEWGNYAISKAGYDISESCVAQQQYIAPDTSSSIYVDMTASNPNAILIHAKTALGADIPDASVRLYRASPAFDETKKAGLRCGQAFWNGLASGTVAGGDPYSVQVSSPPYTSTTTYTDIVDVSGYSTFTAIF